MADNKFNLEVFLRAYLDMLKTYTYYPQAYSRFWGNAIHLYLNKDIIVDHDSNINEENFLVGWNDKMPQSVRSVIDMIKAAKGKPEADEYADTIKFVIECYTSTQDKQPNIRDLQMLVNRLKKSQNKKLVYDALNKLISVGYTRPTVHNTKDKAHNALYKDIAFMLANNPNATLKDVSEIIYFCETPDQAFQVINDVVSKTDEELDKELNKDVPKPEKIQQIVWYPKHVVDIARGDNSEASKAYNEYYGKLRYAQNNELKDFTTKINQWNKIVDDKYDYEKLMESGDSEYVSRYADSVDKKNIDLSTRFDEQNRQMAAERINNERALAEKDREINELTRRINHLENELRNQQERAVRAENDLQNSENKIQEFTRASEKLSKAGMFGRKKIIQEINKISNEK